MALGKIKTNIRSKLNLQAHCGLIKTLQLDAFICWSLKRAGGFREMIKGSTDKAFCVDDFIMHDAFQLALIAAIFFFYFQSAEGIVQLNK